MGPSLDLQNLAEAPVYLVLFIALLLVTGPVNIIIPFVGLQVISLPLPVPRQ